MDKIKHWFWHVFATLYYTDLSEGSVSDVEWANYVRFMRSKGYQDGGLVP